MTTRNDMKTRILADMERDDAVDGAAVKIAIDDAIRHYQPRRFYFNESRSVTVNTVAGQDVYTFGVGEDITTEFYRIDSVVLTDGTEFTDLKQVDYRTIETRVAESNTPWSWAYIDQALRLYPNPDAIYPLRITGHVKLAIPSNDNDASDWFDMGYDLIRQKAKWFYYANNNEDDAGAARMIPLIMEAERAVFSATTDKVTTSRLEPTQF